MRNLAFSLVLVVATGWFSPLYAASPPIIDVSDKHYAYPYLHEVLDQYHLMSRYPDMTFRGSLSFTRYELATMLAELLQQAKTKYKINLPIKQEDTLNFNSVLDDNGGDVSLKHWAAQSVSMVVTTGLMTGYSDMTFRGKNQVSRYELAVQLERALAKFELTPDLGDVVNRELFHPVEDLLVSKGGDLKSDHWAFHAVETVLGRGLMYGQGSLTHHFNGDQPATRYDLAIALSGLARLLEKKYPPPSGPPTPSPTPGKPGN